MLEADPEKFTSSLKGKRIVIAVTASISIYRVPDIIRDLRREGADVIAGMSKEACSMVNPEIFRWATGNEVVTEITGKIEHVSLFEKRASDTLLLVLPASYNVIGKAASGISDDVPSLFFSFALGNGNPIVMSPVMHEGMMVNPVNSGNLDKLRKFGVSVVPPMMESDKAKISDSGKVIDYVVRAFNGNELAGKNILIIGGHGEARIDPVRMITNSGTGFTATWIIRNSFRLGAGRICFVGNTIHGVPDYTDHRHASTFEEFRDNTVALLEKDQFDLVINVASLPDFKVKEEFREKIDSANPVGLDLIPVEKLNRIVRKYHKGKLVTFKLESTFDAKATEKSVSSYSPDIVVFNPYLGKSTPFGSVSNSYTLYKHGKLIELGELAKPEMTLELLGEIRKLFG